MLKAKLLGATAGAEAALAIEDVFSTYLYTGNGSTQTITNGIDLAGEGGMVWAKGRVTTGTHNAIMDTERGTGSWLATNLTGGNYSTSNSITSFNSDGFSLGADNSGNFNYYIGEPYASWTFRKAPRFFDVVTYTGNGANRTIAHDLGVVPGCIIVKRTDTTGDWQVYHRSNTAAPETDYLVLNSTAATVDDNTRWNDTLPTSTVFSLGTATTVNASGGTYVAYLFAHDPLGPSGDGSDGLIACGSYTGNSSDTGPVIDLGWEPQWIMIKRASAIEQWALFDNMRGLPTGGSDATFYADTSNRENSPANWLDITARGFQLRSANTFVNGSGDYIYIAIRRGPMREPTVGTEVFAPVLPSTTTKPLYQTSFPVDVVINMQRLGGTHYIIDRLRGTQLLATSATNAEASNSSYTLDYQNGAFNLTAGSTSWYVGQCFRRAPGFFDVVAYTGTGVARTINHNLGVAPEMMVIKSRSLTDTAWGIYHSGLNVDGDNAPQTDFIRFTDQAALDWVAPWNDTAPTETQFTVGDWNAVNNAGNTYIAYLFATLPGISKVGSYTGNGSSQTINCAFTTGARFILIKRTDTTGDWYVWDTARGIVAGNDPHLSLNTTAAEVTTDDTIDPDNSGFIVNQVAATNVNVNAATYIYLAIA